MSGVDPRVEAERIADAYYSLHGRSLDRPKLAAAIAADAVSGVGGDREANRQAVEILSEANTNLAGQVHNLEVERDRLREAAAKYLAVDGSSGRYDAIALFYALQDVGVLVEQ